MPALHVSLWSEQARRKEGEERRQGVRRKEEGEARGRRKIKNGRGIGENEEDEGSDGQIKPLTTTSDLPR